MEFCPGVNVIIGANGSGKSHLLKVLYASVQAMSGGANEVDRDHPAYRGQWLSGVFKPEDGYLPHLVRDKKGAGTASLGVEMSEGNWSLEFHSHKGLARATDPLGIAQAPNARGVFIPPNEVLAIYPGFVASYEKRELAFDQTYYDLCKALAAAQLKSLDEELSSVSIELGTKIGGNVLKKGDRFYVVSENGRRSLEAHLIAEGHRKLATLIHLIRNGSLHKDSILFWDEPESNMNPRLIKHLAMFLRELAKVGVQVFIATHDYLLTGELSLAAEYKTKPEVPIRFFAMSREGDGPVSIESGDTLADLKDNPILDEFALHYQREQDAAIACMRENAERGDYSGG